MKTLLVIDAQYDFMPGGSLEVKQGDEIIPVINKILPEFDLVVFTKDWHPKIMDAFASSHKGKKPFDTYQTKSGETDTLWPDHCVQYTHGAEIHTGIDLNKIKGETYTFAKGLEIESHPYSGFGGTILAEFLREKKVEHVFIVGLAMDYCVLDTAIDAVMEGFGATVILDGTRAIASDVTETIIMFEEAGVKIIKSWQLPLSSLNFE